jgi:ATP-dependent Clp protease adaptor protein ClpS
MSLLRLAEPDVRRQEDADSEQEIERLYRVLVHNDDVTPFDFVIMILIRFFPLGPAEAERITLTAHISGIALVAVLPLAEAQRRVGRAHFAASLEGFPLTFTIEPEA